MAFFKTLSQKPWQLSNEMLVLSNNEDSANVHKSVNTAINFLLGVITVIFLLFTITLIQRSQAFDFQALSGEPWLPLNDLSLLWQNTLYLVLASLSLILVQNYAKALKRWQLLLLLLFCAGCSALFVFGQISVWQHLHQSGFQIYSNPANSYFYMLTGVHALHIFGGLIALSRVLMQVSTGKLAEELSLSIRMCARYWHYLFLLWLYLFFLLTRNTESFKTIAQLCGF